jgi:hypothetical protein
MRTVQSIETEFNGRKYRSRTEARWAIFFSQIGVEFTYEAERISLSNGESYLPDFFIKDFDAFFEVKAENDEVATEECSRARCLSADRPGQRVWLSIGPPIIDRPNILTLEQWRADTSIEEIMGDPENRYYFLQDRRDDEIYWLQANQVSGDFRRTFLVGGPGTVTDHDRLPVMHANLAAAYTAASSAHW